jgi:hypothetical protein
MHVLQAVEGDCIPPKLSREDRYAISRLASGFALSEDTTKSGPSRRADSRRFRSKLHIDPIADSSCCLLFYFSPVLLLTNSPALSVGGVCPDFAWLALSRAKSGQSRFAVVTGFGSCDAGLVIGHWSWEAGSLPASHDQRPASCPASHDYLPSTLSVRQENVRGEGERRVKRPVARCEIPVLATRLSTLFS